MWKIKPVDCVIKKQWSGSIKIDGFIIEAVILLFRTVFLNFRHIDCIS